jgi:hypothetical protein
LKITFRRFAVLFLFAVSIGAILTSSLVYNFLPVPEDFPAPNVKPLINQYVPLLENSSFLNVNESRVFLLSAEARYGFIDNSQSFLGMRLIQKKWDQCLILRITLRNDYNQTQVSKEFPESYWKFSDGCFIALTASIYNEQGLVRADYQVIPERTSWPVQTVNVKSGETRTFDLYIATNTPDISRFELYIYYVGGPPPTIA